MDKTSSPKIIQDDEIDLVQLVKTIWDGRKTIYNCVAVSVVVGLIIAFASPVKYTASATLLPSADKKGGNMGNLGALAGMAGINLGAMMGDATGIPADLYPQVVNSYPFLKELIHQEFHFEEFEKPLSIYDYILSDSIESVGSKILKYTVKLPWTVKDVIFSKEQGSQETIDYGVLNLSEEELAAIGLVKELIQVEVDSKTGLVTLSVELSEPVLTAQVAQQAVNLLQKYIIDYKTEQVRENLVFIQERFDEKKQDYEETQKAFFNYRDRHRNLVTERVDGQYQRLSDAYTMASSVYNGLAQQLEQAKIKVKEETPVFTVLEPVKVPIKKSAPKKKMIFVVSVFLGGFVGLTIIFGRLIWANIKTKC